MIRFFVFLSLISTILNAQNNLKIFNDADYLNFDVENDETCLSKDEIMEKQVWMEFKNITTEINSDDKEKSTNHIDRTLKELKNIAQMWDCHFKKFHVKNNTNKTMPSMNSIMNFIKEKAAHGGDKIEIKGEQKFYGLFKKKYQYAIEITPEEKVIFEVRVHFRFTKMPEKEKQEFLERVSRVESIWSEALPNNFSLRFIQVENEEDAHYSVKIRAHTRSALYDKFWSSYIGAEDYAHEVTHMLGLNEEYDLMRANVVDFLYGPKELEKNLSKQIMDENAKFSFMVGVDTIRSNKCFVYSLNCVGKSFFIRSGIWKNIAPSIQPYQLHHLLRQLPVNP
jgi:hypothetical protein